MNAHHQRRPQLESLEQRAVPSALHEAHFGLPTQSQAHVHLINATGEGEITSFDMATGQVTKHGSVRLSDTGVLNSDGTFVDHATVTGGTRRFDGATGELVFQGHELADGVHFLDTSITGVVVTEGHRR